MAILFLDTYSYIQRKGIILIMKRNTIYPKFYLNLNKYIPALTALLVFITGLFILFYPPAAGIADQGDFQRVMNVTGLKEMNEQYKNQWFKYVINKYEMLPTSTSRLLGIKPTTSMIYPIAFGKLLCRLFGYNYFDTRVLAFIYLVLYTTALYICLNCMHFKNIYTEVFFSILCAIILADGSYIVWFNSLYGEPMMITGLLLFVSGVLYFVDHENDKIFKKYILLFISSFIFLGSKPQCFTAMPIVIFIMLRVIKINKKQIFSKTNVFIIVTLMALVFYVNGTYAENNASCGVDTKFNSVFYGILKDSENPKKDLAVLGLSPDLSVEAGKHAYLPKDQYVKYVPWSNLTNKEFNEKISNIKLVKFYILNPDRLLKGMKYTASKSFHTETSLGKYEKSEVPDYTAEFNRFTLWSHFRNSVMPKNLLFIAVFYFLLCFFSVIQYIKNKHNSKDNLLIELLWSIIIIGIIQFPMPYIGNGEADTEKQLFLFNYTFDIAFLTAAVWIFNKFISIIQNKRTPRL